MKNHLDTTIRSQKITFNSVNDTAVAEMEPLFNAQKNIIELTRNWSHVWNSVSHEKIMQIRGNAQSGLAKLGFQLRQQGE